MPGKVFENLDNRCKGLGAFYTPREIVHFMCQESLINCLDTGLSGLTTKTRRHEEKPGSENFASSSLCGENTVCDPAIGSGAFPVGMMTEIVRARMVLTPYFNDVAVCPTGSVRTAYHFKRRAILSFLPALTPRKMTA